MPVTETPKAHEVPRAGFTMGSNVHYESVGTALMAASMISLVSSGLSR